MNKSIKIYLSAYNFIAFVLWAWYLVTFISNGFRLSSPALEILTVAQGIALLEIFHALLKWVKSPVGSTIAQVSSRILVVVLLHLFFQRSDLAEIFFCGIGLISIAWSITEIVRYSFYLISLWNPPPYGLLWMRYSFFIALYPMGVIGEWLIILGCLFALGVGLNLHTIATALLSGAYTYYFPVLYKYMWKQRGQKL